MSLLKPRHRAPALAPGPPAAHPDRRAAVPVEPRDPYEVARFLREQPTAPVPRRSFESSQPPGMIAYRLLGHRIIRSQG